MSEASLYAVSDVVSSNDAVISWQLARPPILAQDFPGDRAAGERARDIWYEQWTNGLKLPAFSPAATAAEQKQQTAARTTLWRKALRQYHDKHVRNKDDEASSKRQHRAVTRDAAHAGEQWAVELMSAEAERGRRRRELARQQACEIRAVVQHEQERRRQTTMMETLAFDAGRCALEQVQPPDFRAATHEQHYAVLNTLAPTRIENH